MPCYEVRTMSVEFKAQHKDLLIEAIKKLGWEREMRLVGDTVIVRGMRVDLKTQKAEISEGRMYNDRLNELKRAYSSAALDRVAKRNRWSRKAKDKNKGVLRAF